MKKTKLIRLIALCVVMLVSLTGCRSDKPDTVAVDTDLQLDGGYPIKTDIRLKYWSNLNANVSVIAANLGETPFAQELEKQTGIGIDYIHPAANQAREQLNIMLASGDLPDIIEYDWFNFQGGPEKAVKDEYIISLNDLMAEHAPNLSKYLEDNPDVDKMVMTDSGNYYVFPFIRGDEFLLSFNGPIIRKDWLDTLELPVPETIDEWYQTLTAFKTKMNATAPLSMVMVPETGGGTIGFTDCFIGAYGISRGFYLDGEDVKYGPMQPEFKEFIEEFHKWYKEGLIDINLATVDTKVLDSNVATNATGAFTGGAGSAISKYIDTLSKENQNFDLVGAPYPVLEKGDTAKFAQKEFSYTPSGSAAITTKSKYSELAARFLDFGYSEQGHTLFNFGIENESFKFQDGAPVYSDTIYNNPDGLSMVHALSKYIRACYSGPFVQSKEYAVQYYTLPQQVEAIENWAEADTSLTKLPKITPTAEESSEYARIYNEVDAYVNETFFKMVIGTEPIDNFDSYIKQLKQMNIQRALEIQQNALERYNNR